MTSLILSILLNAQVAEAHVPKAHQPGHAHHHRVRKPKRVDHFHWVWISGHWEVRAHRRVWIRGYWALRPAHRYHSPQVR